MKRIRIFLAIVLMAQLFPAWAVADLVVVVNLQNGTDQLTKPQVINIFLGNNREYPNGTSARPVDLPGAFPEKAQFYRALVHKDLDQMAAYWSRLVFAGNTSPPTLVADSQAVLRLVETNRNAIGYVDRRDADPARVKVVYSLP